MSIMIEMPRYKCHKEVWALKIKEIEMLGDALNYTGARLHFENKRYAPIEVGMDYIEKHKPVKNGYFVVYKDGYQSFSPADAFEDGYTEIK